MILTLLSHLPRMSGFYWARWLEADPATRDADHLVPSQEWIVVEVFVNGSEDDHAAGLRSLVPGVEASQSLENFEWGEKVERHG
jgi:hypothetical protein